jgi:hypothetical protein
MSNFDPALVKEVPIHNLVGVRRIHPEINPAARKVYYNNSILNKLADQRFFSGAKLKEKVSDSKWILTDQLGREMTLTKEPNGVWRLDRVAFNTPTSVLALLNNDPVEIEKLTKYRYLYREAQLGEIASILPRVELNGDRIDLSGSTINGISVLDLPEYEDWSIVLRIVQNGKSHLWQTTVDEVHDVVVIDDEFQDKPAFTPNDAITFDPDALFTWLQVQFILGEEKVGSNFVNLKHAI